VPARDLHQHAAEHRSERRRDEGHHGDEGEATAALVRREYEHRDRESERGEDPGPDPLDHAEADQPFDRPRKGAEP
jgi:hypothetical protein